MIKLYSELAQVYHELKLFLKVNQFDVIKIIKENSAIVTVAKKSQRS